MLLSCSFILATYKAYRTRTRLRNIAVEMTLIMIEFAKFPGCNGNICLEYDPGKWCNFAHGSQKVIKCYMTISTNN